MERKFKYTTGLTHAGVFHADDVFSTAFLKIINPDIIVNRVTRVPVVIPNNTIIYDIGFGRYDHHQKDTESRSNGVKFAAFGLLWRDFGHFIVSDQSVIKFDGSFVQHLDNADNGGATNPMYQAIASFVPNWDDECQDMDAAFFRAVKFAKDILEREIYKLQSEEKAGLLVKNALDNSDGQIVILDRFVPWTDTLVPSVAKFVIFPSLRGGYSAQAVPTTIGGKDQKVPFPADWAGMELGSLNSCLPGLNFCHPGRFLISTDTIQTAVNACKMALGR